VTDLKTAPQGLVIHDFPVQLLDLIDKRIYLVR